MSREITIEKLCLNCGSPSGDTHLCASCSGRKTGKISKEVKKNSTGFEPFIAIKIETSGLAGEDSQLLRLSCIYGDYGGVEVSKRPVLDLLIKHDSINWSQGAKDVSGYLEDEYEKGEIKTLNLDEAREEFKKYLIKCQKISGSWKNVLVGRNVFSLIIPMLKESEMYFDDLIDHQALDLSSLFYFKMKGRASTKQILEKYKVEPPSYKGLDEAWAIVGLMYEEVGTTLKIPTYNWF